MTLSKISLIIENPEKDGLVDVYADGELLITLSENAVIEAGLFVGMDVDQSLLQHIDYTSLLVKAKQKAYNYLSYADMSAHTLRTKLLRAGFDECVADDCVVSLANAGYIDDVRYANMLAKYLADVKNYGPYRITQELKQKGISSDIADIALSSLTTDFGNSIRSNIPKNIDITDKKQVSRLVASLMRKGFGYDAIRSVINELDFDKEEFYD